MSTYTIIFSCIDSCRHRLPYWILLVHLVAYIPVSKRYHLKSKQRFKFYDASFSLSISMTKLLNVVYRAQSSQLATVRDRQIVFENCEFRCLTFKGRLWLLWPRFLEVARKIGSMSAFRVMRALMFLLEYLGCSFCIATYYNL